MVVDMKHLKKIVNVSTYNVRDRNKRLADNLFKM